MGCVEGICQMRYTAATLVSGMWSVLPWPGPLKVLSLFSHIPGLYDEWNPVR